jgi:TonB family protein
MKFTSFCLGLVCQAIFSASAMASSSAIRTDSLTVNPQIVYEVVESIPEFPGGAGAMMKYIAENLVYPQEALNNGIEGTVVIEFIVERDGALSYLQIIRDIGGGCGEAVIDLFKQMPLWKPGTQRDVPVRVKMKAPVRFKMQNPKGSEK